MISEVRQLLDEVQQQEILLLTPNTAIREQVDLIRTLISDPDHPMNLEELFCQRRKLKQLQAVDKLGEYVANLIEDNQQVAEFFIGASVDP